MRVLVKLSFMQMQRVNSFYTAKRLHKGAALRIWHIRYIRRAFDLPFGKTNVG